MVPVATGVAAAVAAGTQHAKARRTVSNALSFGPMSCAFPRSPQDRRASNEKYLPEVTLAGETSRVRGGPSHGSRAADAKTRAQVRRHRDPPPPADRAVAESSIPYGAGASLPVGWRRKGHTPSRRSS